MNSAKKDAVYFFSLKPSKRLILTKGRFSMGDIGRHEEVVSTCLDQFVKKGLYKTTSRDLSKALKLLNCPKIYRQHKKDSL